MSLFRHGRPAARRSPGPKPLRIHLAPPIRRTLGASLRKGKTAYRDAKRARIILLAAEGVANAEIARRLDISVDTVRLWRNRFAVDGSIKTLRDKSRSGRPPTIPAPVRCTLLKLACDRPECSHAPFRDIWTLGSLGKALERETDWSISRSEISRILRAEEIRPHRIRMWLHSPDPDFLPKVEQICGLYLNPPPGATVLCIDEKSGMQALGRKHPMKYSAPGQEGRFEFEYIRNGTRTLLASFEPVTGKVFGQVRKRRTADDLLQFMDAVALRYPHGEVYVIWDNLNIHHGQRWEEFNKRHGGRFHFVHTPIHASWVNQVEIWFGIFHRRVLRYGVFTSADNLSNRVLGFIDHWNGVEAHPFRWTFRGTRKRDKIRKYPVPVGVLKCRSFTPPSAMPRPSRIS